MARQATNSAKGLEVHLKAYLAEDEIAEAFGGHVAQDKQTIPVLIVLSNHGNETYRILRARMRLADARSGTRLEPETFDEMVDDGRWGAGWQLFFSFILLSGMPGYISTVNANAKISPDYALKVFQDVRLDQGAEASGAVFFDPGKAHLKRLNGDWRLVLEAEVMDSLGKEFIEVPLADGRHE